MKKFLVVILVLIAAACVVLIWTGKSAEEIVPDSVREGIANAPAVRAIVFSTSEKTVRPARGDTASQAPTQTEGARIAAAAATADVDSTARRQTDARASELIAGAKQFLSLGDPQNAKAELETVEGLRCSVEIKKEARTLAEKAVPLYESVFAMDPEPIEGLKIYELKGGGKVKGWVMDQSDDAVTLRVEGGGETILQRSDVGHITAVDPDERYEDLMKMYRERKDAIQKGDALAQYDLAVLCRKKGMDDLAVKHLERALWIDENVYGSVGDKRAKKLYLMAVWFGSMGEQDRKNEYESRLKERFPSSNYVAMLKEEAARSRSTKKTSRSPRPRTTSSSPPLSKWEAEGDKAYNTGLGHYRKSMPLMGTRKFDRENKLAMNAFDKAVKYYKKAKREGKASSRIDRKMEEANSLKYGCFKMARVR